MCPNEKKFNSSIHSRFVSGYHALPTDYMDYN